MSGPAAADRGAPALPDREDRARILTDLDTNILVEAGAGSGKTRALVERMVALVRDRGVEVERIAAVTFTRKAASELRQRFQGALETAFASAGEGGERERVGRALAVVDRAFIGTIHAFCARLLRERPLEARLDPGFRETLEDEEARMARRYWNLHLERMAASGDPALRELDRVGIRPASLEGLFKALEGNPDVDFEPRGAAPPDPGDVARLREELDRLLDRAEGLIPDPCPHPKGPDAVQRRLGKALFLRRVLDWEDERDFFEVLGELADKRWSCTYVRWGGDEVKDRVKRLEEDATRLLGKEGEAVPLLERWWAHRYPLALRFAREAAEGYARHRRLAGYLNFNDLLVHTAALLRSHDGARADLGRRYRYLLVDEFQDTDPIQAELVLLLASPPEEGNRWRRVEPRPGALFVVGDPKQSIYRFRRADISVYNTVRDRFDAFGEVLELTANFRSADAVGELVNDVFPNRFPERPTEHQARFAPLNTRPPEKPRVREGVFHYAVSPESGRKDDVAADDARRIAAWIHARTGPGGDRSAGDFMVLTRDRGRLDVYVRALEAWGLPVQVSGAGVSARAEIEEIVVLLRALGDPDDPVATVAALSGLFFGLDAEELLLHVEADGRFDFRSPVRGDGAGHPPVVAALERMRSWWEAAGTEPADVVVGRIVEERGLVPWTAGDELGQLRAGALLYALDAVRVEALEGDSSLPGAVDALEGVLDAAEAEASLEPGRADAVRLMNLHKAKGLEAPVVVLAGPFAAWRPDPSMHVDRAEDGETRGWLVVEEPRGWSTHTIARPLDWPEKAAEEARHLDAEEDRLRYVAVTRAEDELVVARRPGSDDSPWAFLAAWLDEHGTELELPPDPPPDPERLDAGGEEMRERERDLVRRREARGAPTYRFMPVTEWAKAGRGEAGSPVAPAGTPAPTPARGSGPEPEEPQMDLFPAAAPEEPDAADLDGADPARTAPTPEPGADDDVPLHRGPDWGSAVHGALEAATRGAEGAVLRSVARAHLLEYERPLDEAGEPLELPLLLETVRAVLDSDLWGRARRADRRMAEVPFAVPREDGDVPTFLDGQVDLAFREEGGWVLVDYKTDVDPAPSRVAAYERQLRAYATSWEAAVGEPVKERLIFFTRTGETRPV